MHAPSGSQYRGGWGSEPRTHHRVVNTGSAKSSGSRRWRDFPASAPDIEVGANSRLRRSNSAPPDLDIRHRHRPLENRRPSIDGPTAGSLIAPIRSATARACRQQNQDNPRGQAQRDNQDSSCDNHDDDRHGKRHDVYPDSAIHPQTRDALTDVASHEIGGWGIWALQALSGSAVWGVADRDARLQLFEQGAYDPSGGRVILRVLQPPWLRHPARAALA